MTIEINPPSSQKISKSVILLHGLGADGNDFVPIANKLNGLNSPGLRFVFPHAPFRPVTINQGYMMRAWFDIYTMQLDARVDVEGIKESVATVHGLIENEKKLGIATDKVILAGFSQGAVIALATALNYPEPLGGILALSGFLPFADNIIRNASVANKNIPIFIGHGTQDDIVPYALGLATYESLKKQGYSAELYSYAMAHSVCAEEINDIKNWLAKT